MNSNSCRGRHFVVKAAPRLTASGNSVSTSDDDDQPILMEAKFREMVTSINQLISSNKKLDEALQDSYDDDDLLDALKENEALIHRKIYEATSLAAKLNKHGVHISLADKILQYDGSSVLKRLEADQKDKADKNAGDGIYL